ncbi:MAG TPA: hypothetical protein VGL86_27515, partial [Polyangia bacterium]
NELAAWMDEIALPAGFAKKTAGNVQSHPYAPSRPLGDSLGGFVIVDGSDGPGAPLRRGDAFDFTIYLHAAQPIPDGWKLFAHVDGPGRSINADHEPVEGTLPIARMKPGTFVRDRIHVTLPPDWPVGLTTLRVGLWRGRERAKATGAHARPDNAVDAASVTVAP